MQRHLQRERAVRERTSIQSEEDLSASGAVAGRLDVCLASDVERVHHRRGRQELASELEAIHDERLRYFHEHVDLAIKTAWCCRDERQRRVQASWHELDVEAGLSRDCSCYCNGKLITMSISVSLAANAPARWRRLTRTDSSDRSCMLTLTLASLAFAVAWLAWAVLKDTMSSGTLAQPSRLDELLLFGDSITQQAWGPHGHAQVLANLYQRKLCATSSSLRVYAN